MTRVPALAVAGLLVACSTVPNARPRITPAQESSGQQTLNELRTMVFQSFPRDMPGASRSSGQLEAFVGREAFFMAGLNDSLPSCVPLTADPLKLIEERARQARIVIINEHHSSPLDRQFIAGVLKRLRRLGYSIYAAETFTRFESLAHEEVLGFDGWYSNEPTFGRAVRLARSLGYELVPYEETQAQRNAGPQGSVNSVQASNRREESQTENLMTAIFTKNPGARVVIHVGHGHVKERTDPYAPEIIAMAQRLKAATGQDPLTISQTGCRSRGSQDVIGESYERRATEAQGEFSVDLYVGHPKPVYREGRPVWRREAGQKEVQVPADFRHLDERVIVEARPVASSLSVVPVDRLLLWPGERLPLLLPPGSYRIDGFVEKGIIEQAVTLKVK